METPDKSTLRVIDQYKKQVLNVRYLNRYAIKLEAILYVPGVDGPVVISDEDGVTAQGDLAKGNCTARIGKGSPILSFSRVQRV